MPAAVVRVVDSSVLDVVIALVGRSTRADRLMAFLAAHLAKVHVLLLAALLVGGRGQAGRLRRGAAVRTCVGLVLTIAAVAGVGRRVRRARPFTSRPGVRSLVAHGAERSFPSRHSACAAVMTTVAWADAPWVAAIMGLSGAALALSRVYAGLHYPTDILGGSAIGLAIGLLLRRRERVHANGR